MMREKCVIIVGHFNSNTLVQLTTHVYCLTFSRDCQQMFVQTDIGAKLKSYLQNLCPTILLKRHSIKTFWFFS